ncbi:MAG: high-potential iron-sulfur protein [Bdellovibrionaceae bacterium]|nr:high-potential iron-sulfur protein [Pseudobdellovibrionaceae bacterium]
MDHKASRRQFFSNLGSIVGLAVVAPALFSSKVFAEEKRRGRSGEGGGSAASGDLNLPMVEVGKGQAAAVTYVLKHADVKNAALKIERGGVAFEKQTCANCSFYAKVGDKNGKEVGKCQIFPNMLVEGPAWCATWAKKA